MKITFDEAKRQKTLEERGIDFRDAWEVIASAHIEFEDRRTDYGEKRMLCFGTLNDRKMMVGYVKRGDSYHVFSMRKCNDREIRKLWQ